MMYRLKYAIILATVIIFTVSCSSKPKPKEMNVGLTLTNRAVNYELQGSQLMAAYTYSRAVAKFRDMGRFCDMTRVSLLMYTVDPTERNADKLSDADAFSVLGTCMSEQNIVNFLQGRSYDYSSLEEPYKAIAVYYRDNNVSPVKSIASSSSTMDSIRSALYRLVAKYYLDSEPKESIKYVNIAKEIDGKHAWTRNILYDEEILMQAMEKMGNNADIVKQRINILEQSLIDKNK